MKKSFLVLFVFCSFIKSFAQDNLQKYKDSIATLNITELNEESSAVMYRDSIKIKIVCHQILKKIDENNVDEKLIPIAYANLFFWQYSLGDFEKAIEYAKKTNKSATKVDDHFYKCLSLITIGLTYFEKGDYDSAIKYNFEALNIAIRNNLEKLEIACRANIGKFKLAYGDFIGSIDILEKSEKRIKKINKVSISHYFPEIYSDLTLAHLKNGDLEKATHYNNLGKKASEKFNYYKKTHLINEAKIEIDKNNYNKALLLLKNIENIDERNFDSFNIIADFHITKGKTYFLKEDYNNALKEFLVLEKLENKKRINHLNFQEGFSYIAKTYSKLGNSNLALTYFKKALSVFTESEKKKVELISEIINTYDESQINQILKNKNLVPTEFIHKKHTLIEREIQKLNAQKKDKNNYILFIISVFFIFLIISVFLILKTKKRNKEKLDALLVKLSEKETLKPKFKTDTSILKDSEIKRIVKNLNQLEKKHFYLKTDCTASNVAKKLETNSTYLSKTINSYYKKSFTNYINDLRIDYVLKRLKNDKLFRRYSIQSIANEIGFKSRESFNNAFKKETGILPSYFIKELNNKLN